MYEEQMELFNEGGLKDEGGEVDPESGNDVPIGSTKKEVRDDIPAMLSEGEFVFPADVVRYIGLENLMRLRQNAKMGLKKMEAMGQMGNSEEATIPDDMPFDMTDLIIVTGEPKNNKPKEMAQGGVIRAQTGTFVPNTGIAGQRESYFANQQPTVTPSFIPPSSVAPPPPPPSPSTGYLPKFVTQASNYSDPVVNAITGTTANTTNTGTATSTSTTDTKFVPTVDDVYTQKKYINPETGETRMINFYNNSPVNEIPEGFIPFEDYTLDETTTTDLESTSVETTQVRNDDGKKELTKIVADQERKDAAKFKKQLADTIESGSQEDLINLYIQTQRDKKIMTGLALTGIGTIPALFGRFALSSREKQLEEALTKRFGEDWENSEAFKSISEASILDKAKSALSDAFDSAFTKEGRDAYYEKYKAKYDTASHPLGGGKESTLSPREQQAFDNAVASGNVNVANHYAIINHHRALREEKEKTTTTPTISDKKPSIKVDSGIKSSIDNQTKSAFPTGRLPIDTPPSVSDPAGFPDAEQIDLSRMGAGAAQPSVQTDIVDMSTPKKKKKKKKKFDFGKGKTSLTKSEKSKLDKIKSTATEGYKGGR